MDKDFTTNKACVEKHAVLYVPLEASLGADQLQKMRLQQTPIGMFMCAALRLLVLFQTKHRLTF